MGRAFNNEQDKVLGQSEEDEYSAYEKKYQDHAITQQRKLQNTGL